MFKWAAFAADAVVVLGVLYANLVSVLRAA